MAVGICSRMGYFCFDCVIHGCVFQEKKVALIITKKILILLMVRDIKEREIQEEEV